MSARRDDCRAVYTCHFPVLPKRESAGESTGTPPHAAVYARSTDAARLNS
jgi:hypothetical protein